MDKVKVALLNGDVVECYDIKPRIFNTYLIDAWNMPTTRAKSLGQAVYDLHSALSYCDRSHAEKMTRMNVGKLVNLFGRCEELRSDFNTDGGMNIYPAWEHLPKKGGEE